VCHQLGDNARCEAVLAPHADKLGQLDGAAILGRIFAARGKYAQASALLNPFVERRLPKLRAAENAVQTAAQAVKGRVGRQFDTRSAPGFDFAKFDAAPQAQQAQMQWAYYFRVLKEDPGFRSAQQQLAAEGLVTSAALDLGLVLLYRAQALRDPIARRQELEKAEKTFLAVRGQASNNDQYRVNLGQVYYWLGKHAEGRKLFDELLKKHGRSSEMLVRVAQVLRNVGVVSEARALSEEAYNKETNKANKQHAAHLRAVMNRDLDDHITWLERANRDDPLVQASLSEARGDKASRDNRDEEAAKHYREAIATYGRLAESAGTLNNCALAHFALFRVTQERDEFKRGLDKLDRAIALQPDNSIFLSNAPSVVVESAVRDVIGNALDLKQLKQSASLGLLSYLYKDAAGRQKYIDQVRKHPGILKACDYLDKWLLLSPKGVYPYAWLVALHSFTRDEGALRAVWERLQKVELDLADSQRETLDVYAGKKDQKRARDLKMSLARQEKIVQATRKGGGATFAVAAAQLVTLTLGRAYLPDLTVDPDGLVKLAEEAHAAAPSAGTHATLVSALYFRAHRTLIKQDKGYAQLAERTRRSLGRRLLTYVVGEEGPLRARALANADLKRALALSAEGLKAFPDDLGPATWAMLRGSNPAQAERLAVAIRKDRIGDLQRRIGRVMAPLEANGILNAYWLLRMDGKDKEAVALLKQEAPKVPLPLPADE
jgi:tetratricopeptide (TPR) repeat protein